MHRFVIRAVFLILAGSPAFPQGDYDLVLRNGRVVDGSGNPWYAADVGVRAGRIAAIGRLCAGDSAECPARLTMDAAGLVVAPGFIDVHTHVERDIRRLPTADNLLLDGVTSIITGNCGNSETEIAKFFDELRQAGLSINLGTLIGHNSVRRAVMSNEQRDPTADEQSRMEALVEQAMREGALGFSTGLIYVPGTYAKTPEVGDSPARLANTTASTRRTSETKATTSRAACSPPSRRPWRSADRRAHLSRSRTSRCRARNSGVRARAPSP